MAVQPCLCHTLLETPKTGFFMWLNLFLTNMSLIGCLLSRMPGDDSNQSQISCGASMHNWNVSLFTRSGSVDRLTPIYGKISSKMFFSKEQRAL